MDSNFRFRAETKFATQRRLKSSAFFATNSSSVRIFFWRNSARRSIVFIMSSRASVAAGVGAVVGAAAGGRDPDICGGDADPNGCGN